MLTLQISELISSALRGDSQKNSMVLRNILSERQVDLIQDIIIITIIDSYAMLNHISTVFLKFSK